MSKVTYTYESFGGLVVTRTKRRVAKKRFKGLGGSTTHRVRLTECTYTTDVRWYGRSLVGRKLLRTRVRWGDGWEKSR